MEPPHTPDEGQGLPDLSLLNVAMLREMVEAPPAVDADPPEAAQDAVENAPEESPDAAAAPSDDPPPLDEAVAAFMSGDKRLRLGGMEEKAVRSVLMSKRNPDGEDFLGNVIATYGKDAVAARLGLTVAQLDQTTDATARPADGAPADPAAALEAEMESLEEQIAQAEQDFDTEAKAALDKQWRAKNRELTKLSRNAPAPAAKAPDAAAPETTADDAAFKAAVTADQTWTLQHYPDTADEKSPQVVRMKELYAELEQSDDALLYSPKLNSTLALRAAAELGVPAATNKPAPVTRGTPGPVAAVPRRSVVTAPPVDEGRLVANLTAYDLRQMIR
jgi:hypothetical protein